MKSWLRVSRSYLSLILSISLVFPPPPASAQVSEEVLQQQYEAANTYLSRYQEIQAPSASYPQGINPADRFLLMEQSVHPLQLPSVGAIGQRWRLVKLRRLIRRTEAYLQNPVSEATPSAPVPEGEVLNQQILAHVESGRIQDTPLFIWNARPSTEDLERVLTALKEIESRWVEGLLESRHNPTESPLETKARAVPWWDMSVALFRGEDQLSRAQLSNLNHWAEVITATDTDRMELYLGDEKLHSFRLPVEAVVKVGSYLVFTLKDTFDAESQFQNLFFIDLETYTSFMGNQELPVFRLPVAAQAPVQMSLSSDGVLEVAGKRLPADAFSQASRLQQVAFRITSNLVDPVVWKDVLPLVESFQTYASKTIQAGLADAQIDSANFPAVQETLSSLSGSLQTWLTDQARLRGIEQPNLEQIQAILSEERDPQQDPRLEVIRNYAETVATSDALNTRLTSLENQLTTNRKFFGRMKLLFHRLISPNPKASWSIKRALVQHEIGRRIAQGESRLSIALSFLDRPYTTASTIAAGIFALSAPESFMGMLSLGLQTGVSIADAGWVAALGIGEAVATGVSVTAHALFSPFAAIGEQYISNGNWARTLVGLTAFVPFIMSLFFVPHFIFNLHALAKDMKGKKQSFLRRQSEFRRAYFERLAEEERQNRLAQDQQHQDWTPEQEAEIRDILEARVQSEQRRGWFRGLTQRLRNLIRRQPGNVNQQLDEAELASVLESPLPDEALVHTEGEILTEQVDAAVEAYSTDFQAKPSPEKIEDFRSFWAATKHLLFSMASMELSLKRWASIWNEWAGWRFSTVGFGFVPIGFDTKAPLYIRFKAGTFFTRILFPDFFHTVVSRRPGERTIPTALNGGTESRLDRLWRFLGRWTEVALTGQSASSKELLQRMTAFEDKIIDAEKLVYKRAFQAAARALPDYIESSSEMERLFRTSRLSSLAQKEVRELGLKNRIFLQAYTDEVYQKTMKTLLQELLGSVDPDERVVNLLDRFERLASDKPQLYQRLLALAEADQNASREGELSELDLEALKELIVNTFPSDPEGFRIEDSRVEAVVAEALASPQLFDRAKGAAEKKYLSLKNLLRDQKYHAVGEMDPEQNPSMARYADVQERLKKPSALGRAVRQEISKLIVTFPIDLAMKLWLTAGITEGVLKPIQQDMFGENSTFYLSHTAFYGMMGAGFMMSIMGDAWVKIQEDGRHADLNNFGLVPQGEDAERSFARWYWKQFNNPQNSTAANYKFSAKITFWNLPAALVNISAFELMFMNRVDLSFLTAGYILQYGTPIPAAFMKVDQGFELAAHYAARGIKEEYLADPRIQEIVSRDMQRYRNRFTMGWDVVGGMLGLGIGNIQAIPTSQGPRGYIRSFFGGYLPEELIINKLVEPLRGSLGDLPILGPVSHWAADTCRALLTTGNTDLILLDPPRQGN